MIYKEQELPTDPNRNTYDPRRIDGRQYLTWWTEQNETEVEQFMQEDERNRQDAEEPQDEQHSLDTSADLPQQQDSIPTR